MAQYYQLIYQTLTGMGLSEAQAAAIMGNIQNESGGDPESGGIDSNGYWAGGLVAWNTVGYPDIRKLGYQSGNIQQDIVNQLKFLQQTGGFAALGQGTAAQMASNFAHSWERCADCGYNGNDSQLTSRSENADQWMSTIQSNNWGAGGAGVATGTTPNATLSPTSGNDTSIPPPPPLSNIPQLNEYIQEYYPQFAWLLNEPGVASIIDQAIAAGYGSNTGYMQGQIENSEWWKTTSAAMRQYEQTLATTPAETNFNINGSQAQQMLAQVQAAAAQQGVQLTSAQLQGIAQQALMFGWNTQQIDVAIGQDVAFAGPNSTNAATITQSLQQLAGNYFQTLTPAAEQSWAQNIAGGTQTMQQFQAQMAQDAALKWTGYAPQLQQGYNMDQLTNSLRTNVAQLMEVDPSSINFVTNPLYSKMLDYVAPGDKTGVHRVMTQSEADQYIKGTPGFNWDKTQNARDAAATLEDQILTTFGRVGS